VTESEFCKVQHSVVVLEYLLELINESVQLLKKELKGIELKDQSGKQLEMFSTGKVNG
jgi:hypothetical protein